MDKNKKPWFGGENTSQSWVPASWQGWASIGVWGLFVAWATSWLSQQNDSPQTTYNLLYTLMVLFSSAVLYVVTKFKGPKA